MQTLKFRVYIPEHEKLSYFQLGDFDYSDRYLHQYDHSVQQFTGLLDKNKKEIYEGDLLEFAYQEDSKKFVGEVQYFEKFGCFGVVVYKAFETFQDLIEYAQFFNVVGNIYDDMLGAKLRLDKRLAGREKPNLDEVEFGTPHLKED